MKPVTVRYFAILQEWAGKDEEELELLPEETGTALYLRLAELYGFKMSHRFVRLAVDESIVSMDATLQPGSQLVFLPPVSGG